MPVVDSCYWCFMHSPAPLPSPNAFLPSPQVFNGIATKGRTNAICYDFVKGVCQRGSECRYSHDLSLIARTARGGANNTRTGEVCYDYLRWALQCSLCCPLPLEVLGQP